MIHMIHIGSYEIFLKRDGYTIDYCDTCKDYTQCDSIRYLLVLNVMWIPVLPIGIYRKWACRVCRKPPRDVDTRTGIPGAILGLVSFGAATLGVLALCVWMMTRRKSEMWGGMVPGFLVLFFVLVFLDIYGVFQLRKLLRYKKEVCKLRAPVQSYKIETCLDCGVALEPKPHLHCPQCRMRVF